MKGLNELAKELKVQDRTVLDFLFDAQGTSDAQLDQECSEAEDMQKLIRRITVRVERSLTPTVTHSNNNSEIGTEAGPPSNSVSKKKFKFAKFEIKNFGGEYTDWLSWWA